ncbi:hypothetical protein CCYA_CCYA01G0430 [Cyanidiococcus yangmingshanensis]|nr:hypothetical protein CCYA_CCYA01G0430 [Cyanidiococcus yangmingshanensis]
MTCILNEYYYDSDPSLRIASTTEQSSGRKNSLFFECFAIIYHDCSYVYARVQNTETARRMLRLAAWKQTKEASTEDSVRNQSGPVSSTGQPVLTSATLSSPETLHWFSQQRLQYDLTELESTVPEIELSFPNAADISCFEVTLRASEGWYQGVCFRFAFAVPQTYPFRPPQVRCLNPVWHPNLDEHGAVCLNILREDWKPVFTLSSIIYGLLHLLLEPSPDDALNMAAAAMMVADPAAFAARIRQQVRERSP